MIKFIYVRIKLALTTNLTHGRITMLTWLEIRASAKRLGLRDKGQVGYRCDTEGKIPYTFVDPRCNTRLRVGVDPDGEAMLYCWRCESIFNEEPDPPSDEKKPLPEKEATASTRTRIIPFPKPKKVA
jgi:hypothetical protein